MENWIETEKKSWDYEWEECRTSIDPAKWSTMHIRQIYKNAASAPEHITYEDAFSSLLLIDTEYYDIWLDAYADKLDPHDKFWITLEAYSGAPYGLIPKRRMMDLRKIRPSDYLKDLDPELSDVDPITVYRGSVGDPLSVRFDLSWTTDPLIAIYFMDARKNVNAHLWKGIISKDKIIATFNGRNEHEIIQRCGLDDWHEVRLTEEQINAALDEYVYQQKMWYKSIGLM